jgi:hypothetical protein
MYHPARAFVFLTDDPFHLDFSACAFQFPRVMPPHFPSRRSNRPALNLETRLRVRLGQRPDKILPVHIRLKDIPLPLPRPAREDFRSLLAITIGAHHTGPAVLSTFSPKTPNQRRLISAAIPSRKNPRHHFVAETGGSKLAGRRS